MPVYEYFCPKCKIKFELLRPASRADEKTLCQVCQTESARTLSTFACLTKSSSGETTSIASGSCSGCSSTSCATCRP